eukprot:GGOE01019688.1.p1 GENE.GGOE01019688.1~~GGOE01019688.1.p1  ORF type:complete len:313 (+),score=44.04 GGOE01019688.1:43-939(+)
MGDPADRICQRPPPSYEEVHLPQRHHPASGVRVFLPREQEAESDGAGPCPAPAPGWLRWVLLSDTHNRHRELWVPQGDVLVHCGDFTNSGTHSELSDFAEWLGCLPHRHKVVCGGNHDLSLDPPWYASHWQDWHREFQDPTVSLAILQQVCSFVEGRAIEVGTVRMFVSAQQPRQPKARPPMAFGRPRGQPLKEAWRPMPRPLHVLVTHTPPHGVLDTADYGTGTDQPLGDEELMKAVRTNRPLVHVFGHIHRGRGVECKGHTLFINVACSPRGDGPLRGPIVLDLHPQWLSSHCSEP